MKPNIDQIWFTVLIPGILFMGCSRDKNTFSRRAYHNTTSHYNYYFNARELMRAHESSIQNSYVDDYNYVLPIFIYGTDEQAMAAYDNMEEIIKKCSRLIDRHSIYFKNEEYNRWIDETYLLVGKAKFYKREYYGAIEIYEYILIAFKDKPAYYEANIWMARCYMQLGDIKQATLILELQKENLIPVELKGEYYAVLADLEIRSDDLEKACAYLKQSIEYTHDKKKRRRYTYILAQLYHEKKDYPSATKYYGKVLRMRPEYRMAFNAKLNQARSYDVSAQNSEEIKKRLNKMLKDRKNTEFRDQIYFALAEMAFREGDEELGLEYLRKSAASSVSNNKVKAEAYMLLGDIYYDKPKYIEAHAYYDSSLLILPENHPKYEKVDERKKSLDKLVVNLLTIQEEDSLQKIAGMDEKDRDKMIRELIRRYEREEELKRIEQANQFASSYLLANKQSTQDATGQWYFYNQSTKSFGVSDFIKIWGDRELEDNWRRSQRNKQLQLSQNDLEIQQLDSGSAGITKGDPEYYLNQLPLDDSSLEASHGKIILALYDAGNIFRESFLDYRNAIASFERLVNDYDTCRYVESAYYQLYRIYLLTGDGDKANFYRDKILDDYPFSEFARIIKNPDYLRNKRDKKEQVEAYYRATYQLYEYKLYRDVIETCDKSDSIFGNHELKLNFHYLKALAIGKSRSREEFKEALEEVIADSPSSDIGKSAQSILDRINAKQQAKVEREAIYKKNFRDEHVFVVMVPNNSSKVDQIKLALSNYNSKSMGVGKLSVNAVVFNGQYQMVSVKSFKDKTEGMNYLQNISLFPDFDSNAVKNNYDMFLISTENFAYFYQEKDVGTYLSFYDDYYLRN